MNVIQINAQDLSDALLQISFLSFTLFIGALYIYDFLKSIHSWFFTVSGLRARWDIYCRRMYRKHARKHLAHGDSK